MKRFLRILYKHIIFHYSILLVELRYGDIWNLRKKLKSVGGGILKECCIIHIYKGLVRG